MDATQEPLIPWPDESVPAATGGHSSSGSSGRARRRTRRPPSQRADPAHDGSAPGQGSAQLTIGTLDRPSFVIQHHAARSLHYDFRLEWNGVLVSWALPKGVPEGSGNRLAVHTEDHPLSYLTFHGDIEAGNHTMSHVEIWDEGIYQIHDWTDSQIVVTLYPSPDGGLDGRPVTLALIHTARPDAQDWLMRRVHRPA